MGWVTYEEWEAQVPEGVRAEGVWKFYGYRKALFFYDLCWRDCERLLKHPLGRAVGSAVPVLLLPTLKRDMVAGMVKIAFAS